MAAHHDGANAVRQATALAYPGPMDATPVHRLYLDTVIAPTRSLPRRGLAILLGVLIAVNLVIGTAFVLMGAAPVPIFLGLDVLGVAIAFWVSNRQARAGERVQISAEHVKVLREGKHGSQTVWSSPTAFTRVRLEESGRYGAQVRLMLSGRRLTIGQVLGPAERAGLADAIDDAIRSARAERHQAP
jgi:uncharacterized membrane protein